MKTTKTVRQIRRSKGYWQGRTDAELLAYNFYTADPTLLEDLLDQMPDTDEVPDVEFSYDTLLTGTGMVRCIHCKKKAVNHNRGFVLRFADGRRMLFGRDCGEKVYGAEFSESRQDFETMLRRADLLKRRQNVYDNRRELSDLFELVQEDASWAEFEKLRREFLALFKDVVSKISEAVRFHDGVLFAEQKVRDIDREAEFEERHGRQVTFFKAVFAPVHTLLGRSFFAANPLRGSEIVDMCKRARAAVWTIGIGDMANRDIELVLRSLGDIVEKLREQAKRLGDTPLALSTDNAAGIERWMLALSPGSGGIRVEPGRLYRCNSRGEIRQVQSTWGSWFLASMDLPAVLPVAPNTQIDRIGSILSWRP